MPKGPASPSNAACSLRASASDLARFLMELGNSQSAPADLVDQIRTSQMRVNENSSWALGIDIQHSLQGDSLWHGGDSRGFHSLMVIYPDQRLGVVVLTNGEGGGPVAHDLAQRTLGGKADWRLW